jgi:hypothetical protein
MKLWVRDISSFSEIAQVFQSVAREVSIEELPSPRFRTIPQMDNTAANWLTGLGVFFTFSGLVAIFTGQADSFGLPLLTVVVGFIMLYAGVKKHESPGSHAARVAVVRREDESQWALQVDAQATQIESELWNQLGAHIAKAIGVPTRLWTAFTQEMREKRDLRRTEWRVAWWTAQSEYPDPPTASAARLGHDDYEAFSAEWMRSIGWVTAAETRYSRDGGVDIISKEYVVQCKHYDGGYVGAKDVREIFGVATMKSRKAAVITSGRFTADAMDFAKKADVALIILDERDARPQALNSAARELINGPSSPED